MALDDDRLQARIEELEAEERRLRTQEAESIATERPDRNAADAERLEQVRVELDQLWDYRRQRRALREAGADPDEARLRDPSIVEGYLG
jgi:hypothetical protein